MAKKYINLCSILATEEVQIKTTMIYHCTCIRTAKVEILAGLNAPVHAENLELSYVTGRI